ncbi:hypothetical protein SAMN05660772_02575 [Pasteurella testudinis DSM 23072]|uniref:Uncharacterized protein n=1 Tax=Pasteurella testudinis DSM 23072 TaxID=1122938 RepID=A0A1W1UXV3_9PAST|nr:hypothetical protein [Pasteurella testudinis]SMB85948.1 hypothetical protein SAMN05660772_02575 [Pasteurella testudinis DSM 23072]SUB51505.1 Predicted O-linked N-acetylglucosamine transferase, SPINDLY family [Pasteurella testudinis]
MKKTARFQAVKQKKKQHIVRDLQQKFVTAYAKADFPLAITQLRQLLTIAPSAAKWSNLATCYIKLADWQQAMEAAAQALKLDNQNLNAYDVLSHACGESGKFDLVRIYGKAALNIRDSLFREKKFELNPFPFNPLPSGQKCGRKKIIAFSLYGASSVYCEPAVMNCELQSRIYPDWICRFYLDDSVPESVVQRLQANGAEIVYVTAEQKKIPATMWRFLALDDESVARVIFRDADSVISQREAEAVAQWCESDLPFHMIRDCGSHTELILAGLWGAISGVLPPMSGLIRQYVASQKLDPRFADQYFLRQYLWPVVREHILQHDSQFGFMNAPDLPSPNPNGHNKLTIGYNEGCPHFSAPVNFADNTPVIWTLESEIDPLINKDGSFNYRPMTTICAYRTLVKNGKIEGNLPWRYLQGLADKKTLIRVRKAE